jgi:hypothetical protein
LIGRVQAELLAQQNRELKRRPADSFQSFLCVMRGGPSRGATRYLSCGLVARQGRAVAWGEAASPCVCRSTASRLTRARARGLKPLCSAGAVPFRKHSR